MGSPARQTDGAPQSLAVSLPLGRTRGALLPATYLPDARTIELVWTTGARVRRFDFWEGREWDEELSLADGAVDLARLNAGASVLAAHQSYGLDGVIGVVERAWLQGTGTGREGRAVVRLSTDESVASIVHKIEEGVIRHVSVGYRTHQLDEIDGPRDEPPIFLAPRWEPYEVSFCAVPADAGAGVRGQEHDAARFPCVVQRRAIMGPEQTVTDPPKSKVARTRAAERPPGDEPQPGVPPPPPEPADDDDDKEKSDASAERATVAERTRSGEITKAVRAAGLPATLAETLIANGTTVADARRQVIDKLAEQQAAIRSTGPSGVVVGASGYDAVRRGIQNVLLYRVSPSKHPLTEEGKHWLGMPVLEVARALLEAQGVYTRGTSRIELAGIALGKQRPTMLREGPHSFITTSDFPALLAQVARVQLTAGYEATPRTFPPWTRQTTLPDFRITNRVSLGLGPKFLPVPEHSEYKRGKLAVGAAEPMQIETYGRMLAFTRQAMVNDDLGLFNRIPQLFGNAAAQLESDVVYGILTVNPLMADGFALFSTQHANLQTAAQITVQSLSAARQAMMAQKSVDGQNITAIPRFLIVGPIQELAAQQLLAGTYVPVQANQVMPPEFARSLALITDARITDTAWFLSADPAQIDTIEYAYLEGAPQGGPALETKDGWDIDGIEYKARMDFDAAPIDYRGLVKNPGLMPTGLQEQLTTRGAAAGQTPAA